MKLSTKMTLAFVAFGDPGRPPLVQRGLRDRTATTRRRTGAPHALGQAAAMAASGSYRQFAPQERPERVRPPSPSWDQLDQEKEQKFDAILKVFNEVAADFDFPAASIYLVGTTGGPSPTKNQGDHPRAATVGRASLDKKHAPVRLQRRRGPLTRDNPKDDDRESSWALGLQAAEGLDGP